MTNSNSHDCVCKYSVSFFLDINPDTATTQKIQLLCFLVLTEPQIKSTVLHWRRVECEIRGDTLFQLFPVRTRPNDWSSQLSWLCVTHRWPVGADIKSLYRSLVQNARCRWNYSTQLKRQTYSHRIKTRGIVFINFTESLGAILKISPLHWSTPPCSFRQRLIY